MKKEKILIERNLKFANTYIYLETIRGSIETDNFCSCANCGKLITNMVKIANKETKEIHYIGTDCAETLASAKSLYNNGSQTDFRIDIYSLNITTRFVTELNKGKDYINRSDWQLEIIKDNGKPIFCYKKDLQKFYPELIKN